MLGVIALAIVPRALGPADFGRFDFLTSNFKLLLDTLTLQLPVAYFNWISRKGHAEDTTYASGLTFYWSAGVALLCAGFIFLAVRIRLSNWLWPDVKPFHLWLALILVFGTFVYQLCVYLADGRALTVGLEKIRLAQTAVRTGGIFLLFALGVLTLTAYFAIQIIVVVLTIVVTTIWLAHRGAFTRRVFKIWSHGQEERSRFNSFALSFARPLMAIMLAGFAYAYFDRWFLQIVAGSSQQGYYGLSERIGAVIFVFTSAVTPLLAREFAVAHEENNLDRLRSLFNRISVFVFIAAVAGCFIAVQSPAIVQLLGGKRYEGAIVPVSIMALFPIHQTFGQLSGGLLIATGQTKLYAKIAISLMVLSGPIAYFLLAPSTFAVPGLQLGAVGLAAKMVVVQFVGTNVQLYWSTKWLGVRFRKWVLLQLQVIGATMLFAVLSHLLAKNVSDEMVSQLNVFHLAPTVFGQVSRLGIAAITYAFLIGGLVWIAPKMVGIGDQEVRQLVLSFRKNRKDSL